MILKQLSDFLDSHDIKYVIIVHSPAFTAQEIAASAHVPGQELAKTVMIKVDGRIMMAVLPASEHIDFRLLRESLRANAVALATEAEFKGLFPGCEVGAMPPFGNIFNLDVVVAEDLAEDEEIVFNAGSHRERVKVLYRDFERLVQPKRAQFAVGRPIHMGTQATT
jgi:Ala-tRNA(Pro) deacylase